MNIKFLDAINLIPPFISPYTIEGDSLHSIWDISLKVFSAIYLLHKSYYNSLRKSNHLSHNYFREWVIVFTYKPLRDYLDSKGLSIKRITAELGLSTNVGVALNNDRSVKLEHIATICVHLNLPIEAVVEITRNTDA